MQLLAARGCVCGHIQAQGFLQTSKSGCGANRMAGIGIAVPNGSPPGFILLEHFGDGIRNHHCAKGKIAIGDRLGGAHEIRLNPPVP